MPQPLYTWEKNPKYLMNRRLSEPQTQSGYSGEVKNL
jgi:hypothetical protein